MPYHDTMWGWNGMWFGPFLTLGAFVLFVVLIVLIVRWLSGGNDRTPLRGNNALDILDERYAKGEIDQQEYEERKKVLRG